MTMALEGIKVADFGNTIVGPLEGQILADHGAIVVRVEAHRYVDTLRACSPYVDGVPGINRSGFFANENRNKYGISIDLNRPTGRKIGVKLALWADVVIENFTPGQMKKWGLDYESLKEVKPGIIYISACIHGQEGPYATFPGFGIFASSMAGISHLSGWPDRAPTPPYGSYPDYVNPYLGIPCILAGLDYKRRTGKGVHFDQSEFESMVHLLAPAVMDYFANGREMARNGNRLPYAAPHGVYPCQGDDRWIAIAIFTDEEWTAFCKISGKELWFGDERFRTLRLRKKNEDELDRMVAEWTRDYTPEELESKLQSAGIAASLVETNQDICEDPQLQHREHFWWLDHPEMGRHQVEAPSFKLSKTPAKPQRGAPTLGQHNEFALKQLLGLSDDEIADALIEGGITTDSDLPEFRSLL